MSNIINDQILEQIAEEVEQLPEVMVVNEVMDRPKSMWGVSPASDSWDEFFAFADMDALKEKLIMKRFEEMSR
tara:strand:- start:914 stop:1132 length:219 start_codon:yes stop_codon:yes gene_type:complete